MAQINKSNKNKQKQQNKKGAAEKSGKKQTVKKSSCCWFLGSIVLLGAISALIIYDVQTNGNGIFEKSATGKFLKNAGALPYVEAVWYKTLSCSAKVYKWSGKNLPIYYEKVKTFSIPYVHLCCDLLKIILNSMLNAWEAFTTYVKLKTPILVDFIEQYVPGLCKTVQDFSFSAFDLSANVYNNGCNFLKTKVFIGSLSPESLGKALNQTQITAAKYMRWFNEKVDVYAAIK